MTRLPIRISETPDYVNYRGYVDEYPINFRVNKHNLNVEISLSDLLRAADAKNRKTIANLLLDNESIMNEFLDLLTTEA